MCSIIFSFYFVLFCFIHTKVLSIHGGQEQIVKSSTHQDTASDIATRIVQSMIIDVPDSCQHVDAVIGDVCIHKMVCSHAHMNDLKSTFVLPNTIHVQLLGIDLICKGEYSYSLGNSRGDLSASVTVTTLSLDVTVQRNETSIYPSLITVPKCDMPTVQLKLTFSGSVSAWVLSLISPVVEDMVKTAITKQTCPQLSASIATQGTNLVQNKIDPFLVQMIGSSLPDEVDTSMQPTMYVNWAESLVVGVNQFVFSDWTRQVSQCFTGISSFFPVGRLIRHLLKEEDGFVVTIGEHALSSLGPIKMFGNVSMILNQIRISGLENVVASNALEPSLTSRLALMTSLSCPSLQVDLNVLLVDDMSGEIISDQSVVQIVLTDAVVELELMVGAVNKRINAIHLENIADLKYWIETIDFVNATSVAMPYMTSIDIHTFIAAASSASAPVPASPASNTFNRQGNDNDNGSGIHGDSSNSVKSESGGSLDGEILAIVDHVAHLVMVEYDDLLTSSVKALIQGYLRGILNHNLHLWLIRGKKLVAATTGNVQKGYTSATADTTWISWDDFRPLKALHGLLYALPIPDMNRLTACFPRPSMPANQSAMGGLSIGGMDTLFDFSFLDPIAWKSQDLTTSVGVGACRDMADTDNGDSDRNGTCTPITLNYTTNSFSVTVVMRNFRLYFDVLVKLGVKAFKGLKLSDVAQPTCLLPWFQGLTVDTLHMAASNIEVGAKMTTSMGKEGDSVIPPDRMVDVTSLASELFEILGSSTLLLHIDHLIGQWKDHMTSLCTMTFVRPVFPPAPVAPSPADIFAPPDLNFLPKLQNIPGFYVAIAAVLLVVKFAMLRGCIRGLSKGCVMGLSRPGSPGIGQELSTFHFQGPLAHDDDDEDLQLAMKHISSPMPMITSEHRRPISCTISSRGESNSGKASSSNTAAYITQKWTLTPSPSTTSTSSGGSSITMRSVVWSLVDSLLPTAIIGNMALFLYSNMTTDAVGLIVGMTYQVYSTLPQPVFSFGLVTTVGAMWEAKAYVLAFLVALFSGIWPYVKLIGLLMWWLRSQAMLSTPGYGYRYLQMMESLGKWNLIDFYVMVLLMAVFATRQVLTLVNSDPLVAMINIQPNDGFYAFLLATLLSHVLSHIMCIRHSFMDHPYTTTNTASTPAKPFHNYLTIITTTSTLPGKAKFVVRSRRIARWAHYALLGRQSPPLSPTPTPSSSNSNGDNLSSSYDSPTSLPSVVLRISPVGVFLYFVLVCFCVWCVVKGTTAKTFQIEFSGLSQQLLNIGSPTSTNSTTNTTTNLTSIKSLSFFDVGFMIPRASGLSASQPGIRLMQISYFLFGLFAPLILLVVMMILWVIPLPSYVSRWLMSVVRMLNAWSALDVYCVSVAAIMWEIRQFVGFIVQLTCTGKTKAVLVLLTNSSGRDGDDATCYDVQGHLHPSYLWLVCAVILSHLLVKLTMTCVEKSPSQPSLLEVDDASSSSSTRRQRMAVATSSTSAKQQMTTNSLSSSTCMLGEHTSKDGMIAAALAPLISAEDRDRYCYVSYPLYPYISTSHYQSPSPPVLASCNICGTYRDPVLLLDTELGNLHLSRQSTTDIAARLSNNSNNNNTTTTTTTNNNNNNNNNNYNSSSASITTTANTNEKKRLRNFLQPGNEIPTTPPPISRKHHYCFLGVSTCWTRFTSQCYQLWIEVLYAIGVLQLEDMIVT